MTPIKILVLAGGIGGARFLKGLRAFPNSEITVVVNNGDDITINGLRICPDLDSIIYNLGGGSNLEKGWGQADETWVIQSELAKYSGEAAWFNLGDKDYATHIFRTSLLAQGKQLHEIINLLLAKWKISERILPSTNDYVETMVQLAVPEAGRTQIHFQEWWVKHRAQLVATSFELVGAKKSRPAPGVIEAIEVADLIILAPSNPIVSIGMILEIPGIKEALLNAVAPIVGISPIIGANPVLGMADKCLSALGLETSAASVAKFYGSRREGGLLNAWLIADCDSYQLPEIVALGITTNSIPLLMNDIPATVAMAEAAVLLALTESS